MVRLAKSLIRFFHNILEKTLNEIFCKYNPVIKGTRDLFQFHFFEDVYLSQTNQNFDLGIVLFQFLLYIYHNSYLTSLTNNS